MLPRNNATGQLIWNELQYVSAYLDMYCKVSQGDIAISKIRGNDLHILWDNLDMEYVMQWMYKTRKYTNA